MENFDLFDKWNFAKKKLQNRDREIFYKERQVWWCSIGQNLGTEAYGKGNTFTRPIIIFKKLSSNLFLGIPLTSKDKIGSWYLPIKFKDQKITAVFSQLRVFDKKRLIKRMGQVSDQTFVQIKTGFKRLYCS